MDLLEGIKVKARLSQIWIEMTAMGKRWPHLGALCGGAFWMSCLSVSPFPSLLLFYLWQQAPGFKCVYLCKCESAHGFGPFMLRAGSCGQLKHTVSPEARGAVALERALQDFWCTNATLFLSKLTSLRLRKEMHLTDFVQPITPFCTSSHMLVRTPTGDVACFTRIAFLLTCTI